MRKFMISLALLALSSSALAATTVTFKWTNPNNPAVTPGSTWLDCSSTNTTHCISNLTITRTDVTTVLTSTLKNTDTQYVWTPTGGVPATKMTFSLVVNYVDSSGASFSLAPVTTTVGDVPPAAVTGFTATEQ